MHLLALGLNHRTAPVALRERAAFGPDRLGDALHDLAANAGVHEAAILSTCNRTEIYCRQEGAEPEQLVRWICRYKGLPDRELNGCVYQHPDESAVKHAFRVASGLDSMVVGEPQILGQVKDAYQAARDVGTVGAVLDRCLTMAFRGAKRVRTEIGRAHV